MDKDNRAKVLEAYNRYLIAFVKLKFTWKEFSKYIIYLNGNYQVPKPKKITANISNNHQKYALTWFSLAISILLLYLYFRKKNY